MVALQGREGIGREAHTGVGLDDEMAGLDQGELEGVGKDGVADVDPGLIVTGGGGEGELAAVGDELSGLEAEVVGGVEGGGLLGADGDWPSGIEVQIAG